MLENLSNDALLEERDKLNALLAHRNERIASKERGRLSVRFENKRVAQTPIPPVSNAAFVGKMEAIDAEIAKRNI